jgi:hypothetical protein
MSDACTKVGIKSAVLAQKQHVVPHALWWFRMNWSAEECPWPIAARQVWLMIEKTEAWVAWKGAGVELRGCVSEDRCRSGRCGPAAAVAAAAAACLFICFLCLFHLPSLSWYGLHAFM